MLKLIKLQQNIIIKEIFVHKKIFLFMNILLYTLYFMLWNSDFSMKMTGNLTLVLWIAIFSFLIVKEFTKEERLSFFYLNHLSLPRKYSIIIGNIILLNIVSFFIFIYQIYGLSKNFMLTLAIANLYFFFAISLGILCSFLFSKKIGIICLLALYLYNFLFCNPYQYTAYTKIFSLNDLLYHIQEINIIAITKMLFIILLVIFLIYTNKQFIGLKKSKLYLYIYLVLLFLVIESVTIVSFVNENINQSFYSYTKKDTPIIQLSKIKEDEKNKMSFILHDLSDRYNEIGIDIPNKIKFKKSYLSNFGWLFFERQAPITIEKEAINIMILTPAMTNFVQEDMIYSFVKEGSKAMSEQNRFNMKNTYTRHFLEGSDDVIVQMTCQQIFGSTSNIAQKCNSEIQEIYDAPITNYNYIKRIGLLCYDKHREQYADILQKLNEVSITSDKEFIEVLKERFPEVYYDPYINIFLMDMENGLRNNIRN